MAKQVKYVTLKHEDGTNIMVRVKTTTDRFIMKLIEDYKRIGVFASGAVTWEVK